MSDNESSSTDESYLAKDDQDDSDSEDYSTLESDLYEESGDETFAPLAGGWARVVDVFKDTLPHGCPLLLASHITEGKKKSHTFRKKRYFHDMFF